MDYCKRFQQFGDNPPLPWMQFLHLQSESLALSNESRRGTLIAQTLFHQRLMKIAGALGGGFAEIARYRRLPHLAFPAPG